MDDDYLGVLGGSRTLCVILHKVLFRSEWFWVVLGRFGSFWEVRRGVWRYMGIGEGRERKLETKNRGSSHRKESPHSFFGLSIRSK